MEDVFCDISAFRFYRTPPAVLALFDEPPVARDQATRQGLWKLPFVQHVLGIPIHTLANNINSTNSAKTIKRHLWTGELPLGFIREIEGSGTFTSPEMTLLLMARWMSVPRLALAMYEFCGYFTVYKMSQQISELVRQSGTGRLNYHQSWQQVIDYRGNPTSLWKRPPILSVERLHEFADLCEGVHGAKVYRRAADMVAGVTRSPLEAEAALLLTASRRLGGYGFKAETNHPMRLTRSARRIYQHDYCEADIYIESPDGARIVDVECQGAAVHTGDTAGTSDANRTTALESMGVSVVQITHQDVRSPERFELIAQHVAAKLGYVYPERTPKMYEAERRLRRDLVADWAKLASEDAGV